MADNKNKQQQEEQEASQIREELMRERRNRYLKSLISEAIVNVIAEQAAMAPAAPPVAPNPMTAQGAALPAVDPNAVPGAVPAQQTNPDEFTLDKMIEKLNVIRGGRSFTDPEIYGQLTTLFKGLDEQTKMVIQKTFDDIAKVVTLSTQENNVTDQAAGGISPPNTNSPQPMPQGAPPAGPVAPMASPAPMGI